MFRRRKSLTPANVNAVSRVPGVYIIYSAHGRPFYIGRSRINIRRRLLCHATGCGSRKIRRARERGEALSFEWKEMLSPEQAEAQLIKALGTFAYGNLRRETDPADW
jgi:excinuclease UvrABC nuclease subunit